MRRKSHVSNLFFFFLAVSVISSGCSAEASRALPERTAAAQTAKTLENAKAPTVATIRIEPNSPADTVRVFYKNLRERRFREAIFLTNLRPAIEAMTEAELKDFQADFEAIAKHVPPEIKINGEIMSGNLATVTAELPSEDLDKNEIQQIQLRRDDGVWIILSVGEESEKLIRKEGKNYFYVLRIKAHEDDAREMLDRVVRAQMAYAVQNHGLYADINTLVAGGLLPEDIRTSQSTGYNYSISLSKDKRKYSAAAVPAIYGTTGKLSFEVKLSEKGTAQLTSKDHGARKGK